METPADKIIEHTILRLLDLSKNVDINKLEFAWALYQAKIAINWKYTKYLSFSGMTNIVLKVQPTTLFKYVKSISKAEQFGYTKEDCLKIISTIGWSRFVLGLMRQQRKISVKGFIKKYADMPWSHINRSESSEDTSTDREYSFSIPENFADQLDGILCNYGMTVDPVTGRRHGVRSAIMTYLDSL